jgi:uncharacterized membrane protein
MTRDAFLARLRHGVRRLPRAAVAEIMAEYENYFAEGLAAGRSEAQLAAALGNPARLAAELRLSQRLDAWENGRSAPAALRLVLSAAGLGLLDILLALPVAILAGAAASIVMAAVIVFLIGGATVVAAVLTGAAEGTAPTVLSGIGLMSGSVAAGAAVILVALALAPPARWYARLHTRALRLSPFPSEVP